VSGWPIDGDAEPRATLDEWARSIAGTSGDERDRRIAEKIVELVERVLLLGRRGTA